MLHNIPYIHGHIHTQVWAALVLRNHYVVYVTTLNTLFRATKMRLSKDNFLVDRLIHYFVYYRSFTPNIPGFQGRV